MHPDRPSWSRWGTLTVVALGVLLAAGGCPRRAPTVATRESTSGRVVRDIRVLLAVSRGDVRVRVLGSYAIHDRAGDVGRRGTDLPWSLVSWGPEIELGEWRSHAPWLEIVPEVGGAVEVSRRAGEGWSPARQYAGRLRLLAWDESAVAVINIVGLESYVAGVLPGELYPEFHRESYRAQAIAARTYALYEMSTHSHPEYDVGDGEASQVYVGMSDSPVYRRACAAVTYTRGLVCTWTSPAGERIFCTYFSSACGGMTQDVADAKGLPSIPPLAGGVRCDYCRIAKGEAYRWKPRTLSLAELTARMVRRYPQARSLGQIVEIRTERCPRCQRIYRVRLIGATGQELILRGENFRLAVGSRLMRSTYCRVRMADGLVHFEDGRGFGHGMGLCQWGMEGQARLGRSAADILRFYYPHSHLTRSY